VGKFASPILGCYHRLSTMMSRILRSMSTGSRLITSPSSHRQFHSPFAVLKGDSPLTPPSSPSSVSSVYEKQHDSSPEPVHTPSGRRTYVVSEPDASSKYYEVPSGAYPTSAPYVHLTPTEAPDTHGAQVSSTSFQHLLPTNKSFAQYHKTDQVLAKVRQ
jgi:hypothetical protein